MRMRGTDPVKDFLCSAVESRLDVKRHRRRIALLESQCTKITASLSAVPGGGGTEHGKEGLWATLADAHREEEELVKVSLERYRAVEDFVEKVPDTTYRAILKLRYLEGMSWTRLQFALCDEGVYYSDRHLRRIHDAAVDAAREIWERGEKEHWADQKEEK